MTKQMTIYADGIGETALIDNVIRFIMNDGWLECLNLLDFRRVQCRKNRNGTDRTTQALTFSWVVRHARYL
jgi:hypothetical protein